ncbi:aminoacyl-tRNA hydrolase [Oceanivirga miroungae]|uniref:Peptidyl-tRNA hydrolase n=1 Tax=Oceanivirga miroungae TaxID=1130046 RepID=A0A6I8MBQ5_9FUSO|nr:aminoacyl-tRNA hydrolase [Oceanivirga miroungae]VWL85632.1 peptidyl-tRNA hydrolase [Oceanivirga miroungae]
MKLIVGLGNKGQEYENTRHNIGFIFIDSYLEEKNLHRFKREGFKAEYVKKDDVIFLKPLTYMNLSGTSIREIMNFYKLKSKDIYVIYDDKDIDLGKIRIRDKGSSAGHNGIKNILSNVGDDFIRIKVGIGSKKEYDTISYVLGKFDKEEMEVIDSKKKIINSLIDDIINEVDLEKIKTKYNNK